MNSNTIIKTMDLVFVPNVAYYSFVSAYYCKKLQTCIVHWRHAYMGDSLVRNTVLAFYSVDNLDFCFVPFWVSRGSFLSSTSCFTFTQANNLIIVSLSWLIQGLRSGHLQIYCRVHWNYLILVMFQARWTRIRSCIFM